MSNLVDFMFFFCLVIFIKSMGSYLLMLILLEVFVFLGFLYFMEVGDLGWMNQGFVFSLLFLVTMIFEGVFGLCLMVSLMRSEGNSQYLHW